MFGTRRLGGGRVELVMRRSVGNLYRVTFGDSVEENEAGVRFQTLKAKLPVILLKKFSFSSEKCFMRSIFPVSLQHIHSHSRGE